MQERQPASSLFTQVDITANNESTGRVPDGESQTQLMHQILGALDRQNELLEELVTQANSKQRQRHAEVEQWRKSHPELARACRTASERLSRVQIEFLHSLTEEIDENGESMMDGEFMLNEFVDRFGPRMAHLNGVLQVLSQLGTSAPT
jgi:hypothetical protein